MDWNKGASTGKHVFFPLVFPAYPIWVGGLSLVVFIDSPEVPSRWLSSLDIPTERLLNDSFGELTQNSCWLVRHSAQRISPAKFQGILIVTWMAQCGKPKVPWRSKATDGSWGPFFKGAWKWVVQTETIIIDHSWFIVGLGSSVHK